MASIYLLIHAAYKPQPVLLQAVLLPVHSTLAHPAKFLHAELFGCVVFMDVIFSVTNACSSRVLILTLPSWVTLIAATSTIGTIIETPINAAKLISNDKLG